MAMGLNYGSALRKWRTILKYFKRYNFKATAISSFVKALLYHASRLGGRGCKRLAMSIHNLDVGKREGVSGQRRAPAALPPTHH